MAAVRRPRISLPTGKTSGNRRSRYTMNASDDYQREPCAATVTHLLNQAGAGDPQASADLLPLVYEKLRALAGRKMRQERPDHTLQPTALVHEAYVRLVDATKVQKWEGRWHFFAA